MIKSEIIRDEGAFEKIAPDWERLRQVSGHPSPFLSWPWLWAWWKSFGKGELRIATLREGDALIAAAPLYIGPGPFGPPSHRMIGTGQSDYLDFLVREKDGEALYAQLLDGVLSGRDFDLLVLEQVPPERIEAIRRTARSARAYLQIKPRGHCYTARLPNRWEDYLASLGKNERYNIGRRTRTLERDHGAVYRRIHEPGPALEERVADFFALMLRRLDMRGRGLSVEEAVSLRFHQEIARRFAERGWLNLSLLERDGRALAGLLAFEIGDQLFYYHSGFDPEWAKYSVGMVLMAHCMRDGIARGIREFDFMRGRAGYKMKWRVEERPFYRVALVRTAFGYLRWLAGSLAARVQKRRERGRPGAPGPGASSGTEPRSA